MKKRLILLLGIMAILFISGCTRQQQTASSSDGAVLKLGKQAPDVAFTTIDGKQVKLSDYRGEKVMFWYFATWCPSCFKAAEVLEQNNNKLNGMKIIALKTFGNAGYSGASVSQFAQKNAPATLNYENWIWGDASQQGTSIYNSQNYPDIYFLIDENGVLQAVDGAPAATLNKIINFAQG